MREELTTPAGYSFRRTLLSHGWYALAPFTIGPKGTFLETTVTVSKGRAARLRMTEERDRVVVEIPGRLARAEALAAVAAARHILALDVDLSEFHALVRGDEGLRWIAETGSGRLLRGATPFEDVVKLVLTTNCSWSLTEKMARSLVDLWGDPAPDGTRSFPGPEALARAGARRLRDRAKTGYRAPYLADLSRRVLRGEVVPESWQRDPRATAELAKDLLELPGVGPYVAQNLLKFMGRPQGLGLDSWMRAKYGRLFHGGRRVSDRTIERRYRKLGVWAGPALWLELTRDWWGDGDEPSGGWDSLS
jgi:N-glycosylase/DNA lyase